MKTKTYYEDFELFFSKKFPMAEYLYKASIKEVTGKTAFNWFNFKIEKTRNIKIINIYTRFCTGDELWKYESNGEYVNAKINNLIEIFCVTNNVSSIRSYVLENNLIQY